MQPIMLDDSVVDNVHDGSDDMHTVYSCVSQEYNTSNSYYGINSHSPSSTSMSVIRSYLS